MRIATGLLLAAAAFCAASIAGALPLRNPRPPPPAIILPLSGASLRAVDAPPRRSAVRRRVEQAQQASYRAHGEAAR